MNWRISQIVRHCTKVLLFVAVSVVQVKVKAWEVDLSRRKQDLQKLKGNGPTTVEGKPKEDSGIMGNIFQSMEPTQEIVIMNTDKGFVPDTVRLKRGQNYKIHVINVNDKEKNTSFILDAFSEHHGTFFGQPKTFEVAPKVEGIFSFQCPETAKQGRIVVTPESEGRKPAGE